MAKRVILPSRALPACVLVLLLTAGRYCCTSESGYCEADSNCPLQNADNGDVQAVPDDRQYSVVSYISGAVGSLLRPLKNVIMKTIDEATKIAYKVWIVGIEELHKATKDYIPAVLTLFLFVLCLLFSYLMWRWQARFCYILLIMSGTHILYLIFGPKDVLTMLWRLSYYCIRFTYAIVFDWWYSITFAIVVFGVALTFIIILPCIQKSPQDSIEKKLTLLLNKMSAVENTLEENQRQMVQLLIDLHDQDGQKI